MRLGGRQAGLLAHHRRGRIEPPAERDILLWLGVFGDRMLELVAREADGWLPSLFMLPRPAFYDKLEQLRNAAQAAGRGPDELTCACNVAVRVDDTAEANPRLVAGDPDEVADELTDLVHHGFDFLNLWPQGDTSEQIGRLAEQVIPTVRARAGRTSGGFGRRPVRALTCQTGGWGSYWM